MKDAPVLQSSFWTYAGLVPVSPYLSCMEEPRAGHSTPNMVSPVLSREEGSCLSIAGNAFPNAAQEAVGLPCGKGALLAHAMYDMPWTACCPPGPKSPSLQSCFAASQPLEPVPGVIPPQVQNLAFPSVQLEDPNMQPVQVALSGSTAAPPCSVISVNLLRMHSAPLV